MFKKRIFLLAIINFIGILSFCEKTIAANLQDTMPTITVEGNGEFSVVPDEAVINFGVAVNEKLLSTAYKNTSDKMKSVIYALNKLKINKQDIQTSSLNISPVYPQNDKGIVQPGKPVSYKVSQTLTVKVNNISKVADIIDNAMGAGANTFNNIDFRLSNYHALKLKAKILAIENAKLKAHTMMTSLGLKLGKVLKVDEQSNNKPLYNRTMSFASGMPVEAGSIKVSNSVSIIYEILN